MIQPALGLSHGSASPSSPLEPDPEGTGMVPALISFLRLHPTPCRALLSPLEEPGRGFSFSLPSSSPGNVLQSRALVVTVKTQPKPSPFLAKPHSQMWIQAIPGGGRMAAAWDVPMQLHKLSRTLIQRDHSQSLYLFPFFPHSRSESQVLQPLVLFPRFQEHWRVTFSLPAEGESCRMTNPIPKENQKIKTRQREGNLLPLWMEKKGQ